VTDTTFEEARRCPGCKEPGKEVSARRPHDAPRGTVVHVFTCENTRCPDEGDRWLVQTNPDGSIPQPGQKGPKAFERPRESTTVMQYARDELALMDFMSTHPDLTEREAKRAMGF
jgi:hypothetical protein